MPAQAAARHDQQVDRLVEVLDHRQARAVEGAEVHRVIFGDDAPAGPAGHQPDPHAHELFHRHAGRGRAAPDPEHRPLGAGEQIREHLQLGLAGTRGQRFRQRVPIE